MQASDIAFQKEFLAALSVEILDNVHPVRFTRISPSSLAQILFLKVYCGSTSRRVWQSNDSVSIQKRRPDVSQKRDGNTRGDARRCNGRGHRAPARAMDSTQGVCSAQPAPIHKCILGWCAYGAEKSSQNTCLTLMGLHHIITLQRRRRPVRFLEPSSFTYKSAYMVV